MGFHKSSGQADRPYSPDGENDNDDASAADLPWITEILERKRTQMLQ